MIKLDYKGASDFISASQMAIAGENAVRANMKLESGQGAGSEFRGWLHLPSSMTEAELEQIISAADSLRGKAEVIIVIGIGGSYLGAKAVIDALTDPFLNLKGQAGSPRIVFAGHNLSQDYLWELMDALRDYSIGTIVISKSGTTLEPAITFRVVRSEIEKRYGRKNMKDRIIVVTDPVKGALKDIADREGYRAFAIPPDIGGRFSVFTAAGLLPIAAAGIDIKELIKGAARMENSTSAEVPYILNPALQYAAIRNLLYNKGFKIELFATYEPRMQSLSEWWKQLYGESEGKNGKGIFPAAAVYTTDLHSLGQYVQDGERTIFETVLSVAGSRHEIVLEHDSEWPDGLGYLNDRSVGEIGAIAEKSVAMAHIEGGVPNIRIEMPEISEYRLGALLYFLERACGISGYMLGVNPFDQPGVEAYKNNMYKTLGKPGY